MRKETDDPAGSEGLGGVFPLVQMTLQETNRQATVLGELSREVRGLTEQMQLLTRMLRGEGNGERGVVMRLAAMEQASRNMAEALGQVKIITETRSVEDQKGRWGLAQGVIIAVIALAATVAGHLINALLTGKNR